jgi:hypothetical protein
MFNLNPKHTERLFTCSDNSLDEYDLESDYQEPTKQGEQEDPYATFEKLCNMATKLARRRLRR